jgi:hypothetical protein
VEDVVAVEAHHQGQAEVPGDREHLDSHRPELGQDQANALGLQVADDAVLQEVISLEAERRLQEGGQSPEDGQAGEEGPVIVVVLGKLTAVHVVDPVVELDESVDEGLRVFSRFTLATAILRARGRQPGAGAGRVRRRSGRAWRPAHAGPRWKRSVTPGAAGRNASPTR